VNAVVRKSLIHWTPNKPYLVYVRNRGWTDGTYRPKPQSPSGWCHKWALDDWQDEHRGVIHVAELPPIPNDRIEARR